MPMAVELTDTNEISSLQSGHPLPPCRDVYCPAVAKGSSLFHWRGVSETTLPVAVPESSCSDITMLPSSVEIILPRPRSIWSAAGAIVPSSLLFWVVLWRVCACGEKRRLGSSYLYCSRVGKMRGGIP
jgi:hypothetical protein